MTVYTLNEIMRKLEFITSKLQELDWLRTERDQARNESRSRLEEANLYERQRDEARIEVAELRRRLEQLACLGNGDRPGNSIGNTIAQEALRVTSSYATARLRALEKIAKAAQRASDVAKRALGAHKCVYPDCEACAVDAALATLEEVAR